MTNTDQLKKWDLYVESAASPVIAQRMAAKTVQHDNGCWEWVGAKTSWGYGRLNVAGKGLLAHRLSYITHRGAFDPALVIDHLCRNTSCVNPDHLEPVTSAVNVMRGQSGPARNALKQACKYGHPYDEQNTRFATWHGVTRRYCAACRKARRLADAS